MARLNLTSLESRSLMSATLAAPVPEPTAYLKIVLKDVVVSSAQAEGHDYYTVTMKDIMVSSYQTGAAGNIFVGTGEVPQTREHILLARQVG